MTKKVFTTSAVGIMMLAGSLAPSASAYITAQNVDTVANGQIEVPAQGINSTEVNTVEESRLTQEMLKAEQKRPGMTQEEKKKNAETNDKFGGGITIIAMSIVISALVLLCILFMIFGKIFSTLLTRRKMKTQGETAGAAHDAGTPDSGEVIAAISAALSEHFHNAAQHDIERTILTLRRMKRAYSPWNSKIYNIRHVPEQPISKNRLH